MADGRLSLGIDAGTTKVAAVVRDGEGRQLASRSVEHRADVPAPPGHSLQDPGRLAAAAFEAASSLPGDLRADLGAIGLTGQMHGVILLDQGGAPIGNLVTWQDQRCAGEEDFLRELGERTGRRLSAGYGCATLAWMARHGGIPPEARAAVTVHDWLAARLCGARRPVMDPTDAASFGLFDLERLQWDDGALRAAGIPEDLLPRIVATGSAAGATCEAAARELGVPAGIPVAAAIGDNQASLLAMLEHPDREIMLTLGTGGQLSVVVHRSQLGRWSVAGAPWECRPYLGDGFLVVAASLSAGSAWRWLAESVAGWVREAGGGEIPLETIYARMNELGAVARAELAVSPHFLGERFDPSLRGTIEGIDFGNFSLGSLARGLARGIVSTLRQMLPEAALAGRERAVGSGNALRRNPLLQRMAEEVLGIPLRLTRVAEEAALGAALLAARLAAH